jgi:hypothetical protein
VQATTTTMSHRSRSASSSLDREVLSSVTTAATMGVGGIGSTAAHAIRGRGRSIGDGTSCDALQRTSYGPLSFDVIAPSARYRDDHRGRQGDDHSDDNHDCDTDNGGSSSMGPISHNGSISTPGGAASSSAAAPAAPLLSLSVDEAIGASGMHHVVRCRLPCSRQLGEP